MKAICVGHATYDITLPVETFPVENKKIGEGQPLMLVTYWPFGM